MTGLLSPVHEASSEPLHAHCSSAPGYFAKVTVVGIVQASPNAVFQDVFATPSALPAVFSDVKSVAEVARSQPRVVGASGHVVSEVEVEQVARLYVLRVPVDAAMRVKLECNHTLQQVRLRLVRGNRFMGRYEGLYAVLPFTPGAAAAAALPASLADTLGHDCWRQVNCKVQELHASASRCTCSMGFAGSNKRSGSSSSSQASACAACSAGSGHGTCSQRRQGQAGGTHGTPQHSLVVLHQQLQPALRPPPGLGGVVRGQVRRQFERMFQDLHRACQAASRAAAPPRAPPSLRTQLAERAQALGQSLRRRDLGGLRNHLLASLGAAV